MRLESRRPVDREVDDAFVQLHESRDGTKRNVLIVHRAPWFGGAEKRLLDWLGGIDYSRQRVCLTYTEDVFSHRVRDLKLPVVCAPLKFKIEGRFWQVFFSAFSYFRRMRPDQIVMIDGFFMEWPLPVVLAAYLIVRGRLYMTEHTPAPEPPHTEPPQGNLRRLSIWQLRGRALLSRRVVAVSEQLKQWVVHKYGYPGTKVVVAYHGVDTSRFCKASDMIRRELRASLGVPEDAMVIVSTSRLQSDKRVDRLINAFATAATTWPHLWLLLAGDGPSRSALLRLASSLSAASRIKFLGWLEDVSPLLQASDIYVLSSDFEGFGIALLEAMATELVSIATKTAGPCEVIEDGKNGFLVESSEAAVTEGIQKALQLTGEDREAVGRRARQQVVERFSAREGIRRGLAALDIAVADNLTGPDGPDE